MKSAMEARGFTETGLAKRLGLNTRTLNYYLNDRSEAKFETLLNFCEVTGVEIGDILRRGDDDQINYKLDESESDLVKIGILDVNPDTGQVIRSEDAEQMAFGALWLSKSGIDPSAASLVRINDGSMEPTLQAKSIALIDHRDTTPEATLKIFACRLGDALIIRRVERSIRDQSILLHSDKPGVTTAHLLPEDLGGFEILGRVVWTSRSLPA